jgi:nucleotide-binding universal stress UspA family protein
MLAIRTILHPTDFSQRSENAFRVACALARDYGAKMIVLHVVPRPIVVFSNGIIPPEPENYREEAQRKLAQLQAAEPSISIEKLLVEGDPGKEILRLAAEKKADLIVMGTHGWTGLTRLLMGSVAEAVVRKAPCAVLTVKTPIPEAVTGKPAQTLESVTS